MLIAVKYMHHFALRDHLLSRKFSGNKGKPKFSIFKFQQSRKGFLVSAQMRHSWLER